MYGTKNLSSSSKKNDRHLDRVAYSVSLNENMYKSFKDKAECDNISMNSLLLKWVDEYLKENETKAE